MEPKYTVAAKFDRASEVKAFDEMKTGVKGLVDAGNTKIPRIFHNPEASIIYPKHPSSVTIPTVDLGGVLESKATRESVVAKVRDSMERFGFCEVINHGIPLHVMDKMRDGVRGFHDQDPQVRKTFYSRENKVKYHTNADLHHSPAGSWRDTFTCFMAPDVPKVEDLPQICGEIMLEYSKWVMKLGELIFELLSEALGLKPNHLKEMDCAKGLFLLCHCFPYCPEPDRTLGGAPHTDRSFLTILLPGQIGGLQVLHDGYWIDVPPNPGSLIVNVGDLLQLLSNDKFVSVEHRILANRAKELRISVGAFFVHPSPGSRLYGPIKELLSEENPPKYRDTHVQLSNHYVARSLDGNSSLRHLRI
uniref:Putative 2-oxoacid dependent dioxygenase n=1 Tax=Noccaea caerulescens TaxID=107243 RepID=A0A1J3ER66_NOCCA